MRNKFFKNILIVLGVLCMATVTACDKKDDVAKKLTEDGIYLEFKTTMGDFACKIYYDRVPLIAANIIGLAEGSLEFTDVNTKEQVKRPFYNGLIFHRIIDGFMIQGGCPLGMGYGGPGYSVIDQFDPSLKHDSEGVLSMANSGADTNGSQFFITLAPQPHLDGKHVVFGKVVEGMQVVRNIGKVKTDPRTNKPFADVVMKEVKVIRNGDAAKAFDVAAEMAKQDEIKAGRITKLLEQLGADTRKMVKDEKTGMEYIVMKEGSGRTPNKGEKIKAHYTGYFVTGQVFDSSVRRGEPFEFNVGQGQVIEGWDIALMQMKKGEKRVIILPYYLAYGERGYPGAIPPKATLIFEVELVDLEK